MATDELRMRVARPIDLPEILEILADVSEWEVEEGLPHPWPNPFPASRLLPSIDREELYLADLRGGVGAGTVTLQWSDAPFWGERPPDAGYVHRLAVRRRHAGRGVGRRILEWAASETQARGRAYVRLDCLEDAPRLHRYYEAAGFSPRGTVTVGGLRCALFERSLTR
ncbi:MAG TPA: GNAT family N-acetyltransferase [Thermoplasmata archaeon]|nr:GNAT family N-acetyltransferase [Thermoplasmata archaeon]